MKKVYLFLAALMGISAAAQAQRHCDVEVLPLIGPANGSTYSCNGYVVSGYYFVNNGPDTIKATDSFQLSDPNIDNATLGADPLDFSTFYYYRGYPTGTQLNGAIGDTVLAPRMDIAPGDTLIYYQWNDTVTRLSTLILADTYAINGNGDTMDYYVFTPAGQVPPNGNYFWLARFAGFYGSDVDDPDQTNNFAYSGITLNCQTAGIGNAGFNKLAFTVYPNPANDNVNFTYTLNKAAEVTVRVTDISGRTLLSKDFGRAVSGTNKFTIDVSSLTTGTYFMEVIAGDSRGVNKFTVRK